MDEAGKQGAKGNPPGEEHGHRDSADVLGSERGGMMAGAGLLEERLKMCWFFACV